MRRIAVAVLSVTLTTTGIAASFTDEDLVPSDVLAPAGLVKYWQCPIPLRAGEIIDSLHLEDEMLYALTDRGAVYAVDAEVGLVRWSAVLPEPPFRVFRPTHARTDDPKARMEVYVAGGTHLRVYHRRTGELLSDLQLPFPASGPAIGDGRFIHIGSVNNRYYCLRAMPEGLAVPEPDRRGNKWYAIVVLPNGKRLFEEAESLAKARQWQESWISRFGGIGAERKTAMIRWQLDTSGTVVARPAVVDKVSYISMEDGRQIPSVVDKIAYIPSDGGKLFACGLRGKQKYWEAQAAAGILADPLVDKGVVYFASTDRSLYAVDRIQGTPLWQCYLPVPLRRTGYLTEKVIYQPGEPTGVYAVDAESGKLLWCCEEARDFLARQDTWVYLFEPGRAIHQVQAGTGRITRSMACPAATVSVGNPRDTTWYLTDGSRRLMCIRPKDVPYLRRARFDDALLGAVESKASASRPTTAGPTAATRSGSEQVDDPLRSRSTIPPAVDANPQTGK